MDLKQSVLSRCNIQQVIHIPNDHNIPFIKVVLVDQTFEKQLMSLTAADGSSGGCLPAEKPSTGRLVSSASWRLSKSVLEAVCAEDLDIEKD